jgi:hypothetical protein
MKLSKAYNQYGSSMGRGSDNQLEGKLSLRRVCLDSGGYDNGGAYWGAGAPLWRAEDSEGRESFFRSGDRDAAKTKLRAEFPGVTFYR